MIKLKITIKYLFKQSKYNWKHNKPNKNQKLKRNKHKVVLNRKSKDVL